jgi:hypothetical protein
LGLNPIQTFTTDGVITIPFIVMPNFNPKNSQIYLKWKKIHVSFPQIIQENQPQANTDITENNISFQMEKPQEFGFEILVSLQVWIRSG